MQKQQHRDPDEKPGFFCFVVKDMHSQKRAGASACSRRKEQHRFGNSPQTAPGFVFVDSLKHKSGQADRRQIYEHILTFPG